MNGDSLHLRASAPAYDDMVHLALIARRDGVRVAFAESVTYRQLGDGVASRSFVEVTRDAARGLMDDLWAAGIRPTEFKHTEAATKAMAAHLEDMRTVAFAKLEIPKP